MNLSRQQQAFTFDVAKLIIFISEQGFSCTLGEVYRTQEQARLYALQGMGIINSLHCDKLAIDLNIFSPGNILLTSVKEYVVFGTYWRSLHPLNRWGGTFDRPDANHFE